MHTHDLSLPQWDSLLLAMPLSLSKHLLLSLLIVEQPLALIKIRLLFFSIIIKLSLLNSYATSFLFIESILDLFIIVNYFLFLVYNIRFFVVLPIINFGGITISTVSVLLFSILCNKIVATFSPISC